MGKTYRVIAGSCPCAEQRTILNFGDVKEENFFLEGQAEKLVNGGFIEEVKEDVKEESKKDDKKKDDKKEDEKKSEPKK